MNQRIIYQTDDGGVAVIIPAPEAVEKYGIQAIAEKDAKRETQRATGRRDKGME